MAIDKEVVRRVFAERIRTTLPINDLLWALPFSYQIDIWKGVMNVPDRVQPYQYLGASGRNGFFLPES